ncbi:hypothetical protein A2Y83_00900 [Candidatus Falkowbacteria bacterium RBG_13_39_14]|uniref:AAA+ ATPase domain-containing protein n=1 Tax=Candidatus Falkowbacteria bacterium RBG_13_39_14 TaxID=1797985 RepID=A0A1F5S590_9BACT|nr:MAG: hypothetical protein A2Y83_00900 [Candidatus Falkowbacteria bacterium RBG_13_39_14]
MDKKILKQIILDQRESFLKKTDIIDRDLEKSFIDSRKISVITGVRRSGKSTLLKQIARKFENFLYFNFDDERLIDFTYADFNSLLGLTFEVYNGTKVFFFDEIQNIYGWEKFASRLFAEGYKVFVTGSNAKLLSSELATSLTGRHKTTELYPFGFKEYLMMKKIEFKKDYSTKETSKLKKMFNEYLESSGFPEILISRDKEELKQIYEDILFKDLIVRFKIRDVKSFRELLLFLFSNAGKKISFNNLSKILNFKSVATVKNYIEFFEKVYLLFPVYLFDYSIKKQIKNDRKIYGIDHGLLKTVSFNFSKNNGRYLENLVFIELKRRGINPFYYVTKQGKEIDFLIRKGVKTNELIQVSYELSDKDTFAREIDGLFEGLKEFNLKEGLILTEYEETEIKKDGKKIVIKPVYKWLIDKNIPSNL